MKTMTAYPESILLVRCFSGKYGSMTPVTGFASVCVHFAAYSGRGRSCKRQNYRHH